jgi:hypothetical protein
VLFVLSRSLFFHCLSFSSQSILFLSLLFCLSCKSIGVIRMMERNLKFLMKCMLQVLNCLFNLKRFLGLNC